MNAPTAHSKSRIIGPIILAFALLETVTLYICFSKTREALGSELESKGVAIVGALSYNCQTIMSLDPATVQGFIDDYRKMQDVKYVFVRNENNEFIAHTFSPGIPDEFKQPEFRSKIEKITITLITYKNTEIIDIAAPVMHGLLGNVHIGMNLGGAVKKATASIFKLVVWMSLLIMSMGVTFLYFSIRGVTNALESSNELLQGNIVELAKTREALIASAKLSALGEMAGGVAHEINNPLAVILMRIEQLSRMAQEGPVERQKLLKTIEIVTTNIDRIATIISGLRAFSRDGNRDPKEKKLVSELIAETLSLCKEKFRNHGVSLEINFDENLRKMLTIECRATEISQVLINLLNNSFDAVQSFKKKWVRVDVVEREEFVEISVIDCGLGIPSDIQDKIMQPFFTTKEIGKGTGLGLSIATGIIGGHQGKLFVDNNSQNTKFSILIPKTISGRSEPEHKAA